MKNEMTYKSVKAMFNSCFSCPACSLQHLFSFKVPFGYHASSCGWDCDFYDCYPVVIATGYRSRGMQAIDRDVLANYEKVAREIMVSPLEDDYKKQALDILINDLINDLLGGKK